MHIVITLVLLALWLAAVIGMLHLGRLAMFHFAQGAGPNSTLRRRNIGFRDDPPATT